MSLVGIDSVQEAAAGLEGLAARTPIQRSRVLSERVGGEVFLKCENLQRTGSFKVRGAYHRISRLSDAEKSRGAVAASAGNHAQGVALAASALSVNATVFMPEGASIPKIEATRAYGADVRLEGQVYDDAYSAAQRFAADTGAVMVHPFDHPDVIAGQGTVGLEVLDQLPGISTLVIPVGGGGLIAGVAATAKALNPKIVIIGIEPEGAAGMRASLEAGRVVEVSKLQTIADGLAAKEVGALTLKHVQMYVDDLVTVTDDEIGEALLLVLERSKLLVEAAGAAGVAALMSSRLRLEPPVVVILSGGNVDPLLLMHVIRFGMSTSGRYFSFRTVVDDRPGQLHRLLGVIAETGVNVVGVEHHREGHGLGHLGEVEVAIGVETRGSEQIDELHEQLGSAGYRIEHS